ncbi:DNA metabolism protein [Rahnella variigena]|nr:DNA metabolism protein [Rahnella variigena]
MNPGGARPPHVLRVRSGACAPSESKLAAPPAAHLCLF